MKHWLSASLRVMSVAVSVSVVLVLSVTAAAPLQAQSGGVFEIIRSTVDGGGSTERSPDNLLVRGTIGQPDVGSMSNGAYDLAGGFWASQSRFGLLFRDGFESGDASAWANVVGLAPVPAPALAPVVSQQKNDAEPTPDPPTTQELSE